LPFLISVAFTAGYMMEMEMRERRRKEEEEEEEEKGVKRKRRGSRSTRARRGAETHGSISHSTP